MLSKEQSISCLTAFNIAFKFKIIKSKVVKVSWLFLKARSLAKLRCPRVSCFSAFAEDFLAPCLELLQGFQHVVLIQTSL